MTPENWRINGCIFAPKELVKFGVIQVQTKLIVGPDYEYFDLRKTFRHPTKTRRNRLPEIVEFYSVGSGEIPSSRGLSIALKFFERGYRGVFWVNKSPLKAACSLRENTIWLEWRDEGREHVEPFISACVNERMRVTSEEMDFFDPSVQ